MSANGLCKVGRYDPGQFGVTLASGFEFVQVVEAHHVQNAESARKCLHLLDAFAYRLRRANNPAMFCALFNCHIAVGCIWVEFKQSKRVVASEHG